MSLLSNQAYLITVTAPEIQQLHAQAGARFGTLNGVEVVLDYGDVQAEYQALRNTAGILDLSFRGRLCLTGADRVRFLHGQVTNDVKNLKSGQGCYAALVNAKGKIESDLNIYCLENELLLDFEPGLTPSLTARFEKFIIADDVQVIDITADYGLFSVQGPQADAVVRDFGIGWELPTQPLTFVSVKDSPFGELYCVRSSRGPATGLDIFVPAASLAMLWEKLVHAVRAHGGRPCGWQALEITRIEAGIPRFGQDMDETNLASEAGIEQRAISYTKGCYIGQEVISRIRAYGQVAKALRGLTLDASAPLLPQKGDKIFCNEKQVGYITSSTESPLLQRKIALGYIRREQNEIGTELIIHAVEHRITARIVPLPFTPQ